MATDHVLDGLRLNPDEIAEREFAHGFRGYDVHEVRSYLRAVAGEVARMGAATDLSEVSAPDPRTDAAESGPLSRERLVEMVGDEAARVLHAAEDASAAIRGRAEEKVARMFREARAEAAQIRAKADQARADLLETSEAARSGADDAAASIMAQAEVDAQASRDSAVEQGKAMLTEAQGAREKVLRDLARKRKSARRELAQLRAGIDQLHESYDELRSMLDTSSMVVDGAVDDARRAAADAAHRFERSDGEDDLAVVKLHVGAAEPAVVSAGHDQAAAADTTKDAETQADVSTELPEPDASVEPAPVAMLEVEAPNDTDALTELDRPAVSDVELGDSEQNEEPSRADEPMDVGEKTDVAEDVRAEELSGDSVDRVDSMVPDAELAQRVVNVDQVPTVEDTADVRRSERRTVFRRESAEARGEIADDGETSDELADADDGDTSDELADVDDLGASEEFAELPDLLDDGPVPPPPPSPQLFGRRDTNIDELFARIRTSRESAVAKARDVLDNSDGVGRDDAAGRSDDSGAARRSAEELFAELDAVQSELAADASRILKRVLADELNEVLDACRRADGVESVSELMPEEGVSVYGASLTDILESAARRGAADSAATIDVASVAEMVSLQIGGALRTRVQTYLADEDGLDQRIRSAYREWRRDRADEVAVIAIVKAFNLGIVHGLGESDIVRWVLRDGTCIFPDCGDNSLATDVRSTGEFPTGHTIAPMGVGCRCLVVAADQ